jgi:hypothetical protein
MAKLTSVNSMVYWGYNYRLNGCECQWIGLREHLQESPMILMGKSLVF